MYSKDSQRAEADVMLTPVSEQDGIAATSAAPVNSSVISVALMPGQPLQATILFALPTPTYTGIVFVP